MKILKLNSFAALCVHYIFSTAVSLRRDVKIPSLLPQTFHKMLWIHLRESVTQSMIFADVSKNRLCPLPIHYIVIQYPQQMVQMAFCELQHTFHKQFINVSQHAFVILLLGNFDVSTQNPKMPLRSHVAC